MDDDAALLAGLQHGDSFFPCGTTAFSWGLESLRASGIIRSADDVKRFIAGQLQSRWATCDRPALVGSHHAGTDLDQIVRFDTILEALTLPRELREGSRRSGLALLDVHHRLATPHVDAYRRLVHDRRASGHLAVVQGVVWRGAGMRAEMATGLSAHILCVGILGAALRLTLIGHVQGQQILAALRPTITQLLADPLPHLETMHSYAPETDIAAMRHETMMTRLFAN